MDNDPDAVRSDINLSNVIPQNVMLLDACCEDNTMSA